MRITITAGANVYLISGESHAHADGNFQGRLLNEINLTEALNTVGAMPVTLNLSIRNDDGYVLRSVDLWAATVEIEADGGQAWAGKITAYDNDSDGVLRVVATERAAPEIEIQIPDEVARLVTVDENFHTSAVNVTLPLVVGGTVAAPHLIKGILIDKTQGIYLLCVGEIHQVVKVYRGTEELSTGFDAYTGTALQASYAGIAYVQITDEDLLFNDDGSYAEISAEVVGVKLGASTIDECRNGARFLQYLLTTAATGACGWGLGIASGSLDSTAFTTAISRVDTAGLKLDGVFYFRQTAQAWIDQICQAIRGSYSIGGDGLRRIFVNASGSSVKTYTASNMRVLRDGKGAYTGRVYNKGKLDYGYNPITGQFMQSAFYEDATSIAAIGEQEFYGQSYLIKDAATAQAILEYNCKKSLIGADKVLFETDELAEGCRVGDIITLAHTTKGLTGTYQITSLEIGDYLHTIEAEKYSTDIFTVGTPGPAIEWGTDAPIAASILPGNPSGLNLSTVVDYDSDGDGAARPFIEGTFTPPEGKYLGAAVFWGLGAEPETWNSHGSIRGTTFRVGPVKAGQLYTVKVQLFNSSGASTAITGSIVGGSHTELPPTPTVTASSGLGCVVVNISVSAFSALAGFDIQRQTSAGADETTIVSSFRGTKFTDDSTTILDAYGAYQYRVRAVSNSRQTSAWSAWTSDASATQTQSKDITANQIIAKDFRTACNVGAAQNGVMFNCAGIQAWCDGVKTVDIPTSGSPTFSGTVCASAGEFSGTVCALCGKIGGWNINETCLYSCNVMMNSAGTIGTLNFISGHRGWRADCNGNAEFNNIRARGAVKTVVFEKDEISVVGGHALIRPAAIIASYDYAGFLDAAVNAALEDCWDMLNDLLDSTEAYTDHEFVDYDDYATTEAAYYREIATALGYAVFTAGIAEADYTTGAMETYFGECWDLLNDLLDSSIAAPSFTAANYAAFVALDEEYFDYAAEAIDNPPAFEAMVSATDTAITLESADQFAVGDIVRIKDGLSSDYWGEITSIAGAVVSIEGKSGELFEFEAGQSLVNYGGAGRGGVLLDGQSPLIDVYTHDGEPWNGTDNHVRIGNLCGWGDINDNIYGLAMGNLACNYLRYDTRTGQLKMQGTVTIEDGSTGFQALADRPTCLAEVNSTEGAKLSGIAAGATVGAVWGTNLTGIPATLGTPSGAGLFLSSTHLGFFCNPSWKTYMDCSGNFYLCGAGAHGLAWNSETGVLAIAGSISILGGSGYANLTDKPTCLATINSAEGGKLTSVACNADRTCLNVSCDTAKVNGTAAATVQGGAVKANTALDASNRLITAVIPATAVSPSGAGLYLGSNYLGFYSSGWKTYMDCSGNFYLCGAGAHGLAWNSETGVLAIAGSISILGGSGYANLTDKPTCLATINSAEGGKLTSVACNADRTCLNVSCDTAKVNGTAAATVQGGAAKANTALDASNRLVTAVIPATALAPSTAGLYLGSNYLGYYNGGWKTYMDNAGKFYLCGASGGLAWDGSALTVCGTVCALCGKIGGWSINASCLYSGALIMNSAGSITGNYTAGSAGWCVSCTGAAEFNCVTVRGTVCASAGKIGGFVICGNSLCTGYISGGNTNTFCIQSADDMNSIGLVLGKSCNSSFVSSVTIVTGSGASSIAAPIRVSLAETSCYAVYTNARMYASAFCSSSDRNLKTDIQMVSVLPRLRRMPVTMWRFCGSPDYQIGPMAQDFNCIFQLSHDWQTNLTVGGLDGIALRGVQELDECVACNNRRILDLEGKLACLTQELSLLKAA